MRHGGAQCDGRRCDVLSALVLAFTREKQQARKRNKACADFETNRAEMEKPKHCLRRKQRRKCWLIEQEVQKTRGSFTFFDH